MELELIRLVDGLGWCSGWIWSDVSWTGNGMIGLFHPLLGPFLFRGNTPDELSAADSCFSAFRLRKRSIKSGHQASQARARNTATAGRSTASFCYFCPCMWRGRFFSAKAPLGMPGVVPARACRTSSLPPSPRAITSAPPRPLAARTLLSAGGPWKSR